jgi:hypothetical protein
MVPDVHDDSEVTSELFRLAWQRRSPPELEPGASAGIGQPGGSDHQPPVQWRGGIKPA